MLTNQKYHFGKYLSAILLIVILFSPLATYACNSKLLSQSFLNAFTPTDSLSCLQFYKAPNIAFKDTQSTNNNTEWLNSLYIGYLTNTVYTTDIQRRLAQGYSDNTFGVGKTLSRFELTKLALGANCIDYLQSPQPNTAFTDVPTDNSEMSLIIGKAYNQGIITGIGDKFYPQNSVSWGETVKILLGGSAYFHRDGTSVQTFSATRAGVTDESFRQYVEFAYHMDLISDDIFPQNTLIKRENMAEVVVKYITWFKNIELPCI